VSSPKNVFLVEFCPLTFENSN